MITCPGVARTVAPSSDVVTVTWPEWPAVILRWREGAAGVGVSMPDRGAPDNVTVTAVPGRGGCAGFVRLAPPPGTVPVTPHAATARTTAQAMPTPGADGTLRRFLAGTSTWTRTLRVRFRSSAVRGRRLAARRPPGPGRGFWSASRRWAAQIARPAGTCTSSVRLGPGRVPHAVVSTPAPGIAGARQPRRPGAGPVSELPRASLSQCGGRASARLAERRPHADQ